MTRIRPDGPVVVQADDGTRAFPTWHDAAGSMEGYDVVSGVYRAWDSHGLPLTIEGEDSPAPPEVWVDPDNSGPPEPDRVADLLRDDLRHTNVERFPLHISDLDAATLADLIGEELRIKQLVEAPGPVRRFLGRLFGHTAVDNTK